MAIDPTYSFTLIGTNGRKTTLRFKGQTIDEATPADDFVAAAAALEALRLELNDVTDANVDDYNFSVQGTGAVGGLPAAADVYEEALLTVDITPPGGATKLASTRIPAPALAIFSAPTGPGRDIVDISDADLQAYVGALGDYALVSDGEVINSLVSGIRRLKGGAAS